MHARLKKYKGKLDSINEIYWICGGSAAGKTTLCKILQVKYSFEIYDINSHVDGDYNSRYTKEKHPVHWRFVQNSQPMEWLLNKSWEEYLQFNIKTNIEYIDLLVVDMNTIDRKRNIVVDGGELTVPSMLAEIIPEDRVFWTKASEKLRLKAWESRSWAREIVQTFKEPSKSWEKWMEYDRKLSKFIKRYCRSCGVELHVREQSHSFDDFFESLTKYFEL